MTLTTHILVGAAVATPFATNGYVPGAFAVAIASHYLLDSIPHWSYRLHSIEHMEDKARRVFSPHIKNLSDDAKKIISDFALGIFLAAMALWEGGIFSFSLLLAASSAALPDLLQGVQVLYKKFPMPYIQRLHDFFHFENGGVHDLPPTVTTVGTQVLLVIMSILWLAN